MIFREIIRAGSIFLSILLGAVWLRLIVEGGLGVRKLADLTDPEWGYPFSPESAPRLAIVVPGCNEEAAVRGALASLTALDYPNFEIVAIDDRSTDQTGEIMDEVAAQARARGDHPRVTVVHIKELPAGWLGKTHAMWTGANAVRSDWILFTDADCIFRSDCLRRALAYAESSGADHLVLFPTMLRESWGETMMFSFFQTLFNFAHRPWKVADPRAPDHVGVGAFNLIRRSAYSQVGTYEALRLSVVDDMDLGKLVKHRGLKQRVAFGEGLVSLHWAKGAFGVVNNLSKNLFAFFKFSWLRALGGAIGLAFLSLGPFAGLVWAHGWVRLGYGIAVASIAVLYIGMQKKTKISPLFFFLYPLGGVLGVYAILRSAFITTVHGGVTWRGTKYSIAELKAGGLSNSL